MKRLIVRTLFTNKNRIFFIITNILATAFVVLLSYDKYGINDQLYDSSFINNSYFYLIEQFYPFIIYLLMIMLMMEHDQMVYDLLIASKSRSYVYKNKTVVYFLLATFLFIFYGWLLIATKALIFINVEVEFRGFLFLVYLYLESIIIINLLMMFINKSNKLIIFIPLLLLIMITLFQQDNKNLFLFYIIPIGSISFSNHNLTILYLILYILLATTINYIRNEKRNIFIY